MDVVPKVLSEREAAAYLGISPITLRQGRCDGRRSNRMPPPPFLRIGRKILYMVSDLDHYLQSFRVNP
jgi:hypothetical protein